MKKEGETARTRDVVKTACSGCMGVCRAHIHMVAVEPHGFVCAGVEAIIAAPLTVPDSRAGGLGAAARPPKTTTAAARRRQHGIHWAASTRVDTRASTPGLLNPDLDCFLGSCRAHSGTSMDVARGFVRPLRQL